MWIKLQNLKLPEKSYETAQQHLLPLRLMCISLQREARVEMSHGECFNDSSSNCLQHHVVLGRHSLGKKRSRLSDMWESFLSRQNVAATSHVPLERAKHCM